MFAAIYATELYGYISFLVTVFIILLHILIIAMPFVIWTMRRSIERELDEIEKEIQKLKDFESVSSDTN